MTAVVDIHFKWPFKNILRTANRPWFDKAPAHQSGIVNWRYFCFGQISWEPCKFWSHKTGRSGLQHCSIVQLENRTERGWFVQSALTDTDIPMLCWSLFCLFVLLHHGFNQVPSKILLTQRYGVWRSNVWAAGQLGTNHSTNIQTKAITHGTTL